MAANPLTAVKSVTLQNVLFCHLCNGTNFCLSDLRGRTVVIQIALVMAVTVFKTNVCFVTFKIIIQVFLLDYVTILTNKTWIP